MTIKFCTCRQKLIVATIFRNIESAECAECCLLKIKTNFVFWDRPQCEYTANLCSEIAVKVQWNDCNLVWSTVSHCMQWLTVIIWITYLQLLQSLNSNPFFGGRIAKIASKQCNTTVAFACCNIWKWRSSIIAVAWLQFCLQWKNC